MSVSVWAHAYIQACTYACGGLVNPSMSESHPPKQAHEHPEAKGCIFHLPVSLPPPPTPTHLKDGQGGKKGGGENLVPDKPLIPPPPVPSSQSWAPAGWTDG